MQKKGKTRFFDNCAHCNVDTPHQRLFLYCWSGFILLLCRDRKNEVGQAVSISKQKSASRGVSAGLGQRWDSLSDETPEARKTTTLKFLTQD